jgi:DNA repair exonuclease SbcCD ATPase subunit
MADIGSSNWLVSPNKDVESMWLDVQIQEKRSRMAGSKRAILEAEQKIEDIQKGVILDLKAKVIMLEREIKFLQQKKQSQDIVDAETQ